MADNAIVKQAKEFAGRLTRIQKIIIGSVVGAVITGIIIIIVSASGGEEEMAVLFNSLEEKDAAQITEKLKEKNIDYELKDNGRTILVDKQAVYDTRIDLAGEGLPEQGGVGYEIFDKTNLGMSEFVQRLNYRRALEGELARTINSLEEVKKSRVHIVIPEKALFEKDQKEPSASVTLHLKAGSSISKLSIEGIQNLVASSVEGMKDGQVTVVNNRGKVLSEAPIDQSTVAGMTAVQHQQQQQFEQYLANKVQSLLDGVLGVGNSEVRVNSELNFTQVERTTTDYDPERQVARSEQIITEQSESTDSLSYPAVNMAKDEQNVITNYEIKKSEEKVVQEVGSVERLSVAVLINGSYEVVEKEGAKQMEYQPRGEEEMNKLKEIVKNAVGYDPTRNDQVSVLNVPFDTMVDERELEEYYEELWYLNPDMQRLIGLVLAMLVVIFIMYRLLQSKHIKDRLRIAFALPEKVEVEEPEEEEEEEEEELEEFDLDEDLLLLPAELPEQLLLEGEKAEKEMDKSLDEEETTIDKDVLAERAKAKLDEAEQPEMTEEAVMKLEIKRKVEDYMEEQSEEAAKLVRLFMAQDVNERGFRF
jgi:flagellar M-ring protein FliF